MENEFGQRTADILDLASARRREREVVDVEQQRTLFVIFELGEPQPSGAGGADSRSNDRSRGEGSFGLPATVVESIVPVQEITYVPGTPDWILGVVNVRGEIESVLDLRAVLGLGPAEVDADSRLLIAHHEGLRSGLLVDRVIDIADVATASISAAPPPQEGGKGIYVRGEVDYFDRPLLILDLAEIMGRALEGDRI